MWSLLLRASALPSLGRFGVVLRCCALGDRVTEDVTFLIDRMPVILLESTCSRLSEEQFQPVEDAHPLRRIARILEKHIVLLKRSYFQETRL